MSSSWPTHESRGVAVAVGKRAQARLEPRAHEVAHARDAPAELPQLGFEMVAFHQPNLPVM